MTPRCVFKPTIQFRLEYALTPWLVSLANQELIAKVDVLRIVEVVKNKSVFLALKDSG